MSHWCAVVWDMQKDVDVNEKSEMRNVLHRGHSIITSRSRGVGVMPNVTLCDGRREGCLKCDTTHIKKIICTF